MKDFRIIKTALVFLLTMTFGLLLPIFGQWYTEQTGIIPFALYFVGTIASITMVILSMYKIWGDL